MQIVVISDTHGLHHKIKPLPEGDVLVHCGDFSNVGERPDVENFINWFVSRPHKHKIFIAGNHDRSFDPKFNLEVNPYWTQDMRAKANIKPMWVTNLINNLPENVHYLEDSGVTIEGVSFWGSPWTPDFHAQHWGFNKSRGEEIRKIWDKIPNEVDFLITHGPPLDYGDFVDRTRERVGCKDLKDTIKRIQPVLHCFGHIHCGRGHYYDEKTNYINAASCDEEYKPINKPIDFLLENKIVTIEKI